jgi:hypothetical protein
MFPQADAAHTARLVNLEAALCSVLREAQESFPFDAPDAINVRASIEEGQTVIELEYLRAGVACAGESL